MRSRLYPALVCPSLSALRAPSTGRLPPHYGRIGHLRTGRIHGGRYLGAPGEGDGAYSAHWVQAAIRLRAAMTCVGRLSHGITARTASAMVRSQPVREPTSCCPGLASGWRGGPDNPLRRFSHTDSPTAPSAQCPDLHGPARGPGDVRPAVRLMVRAVVRLAVQAATTLIRGQPMHGFIVQSTASHAPARRHKTAPVTKTCHPQHVDYEAECSRPGPLRAGQPHPRRLTAPPCTPHHSPHHNPQGPHQKPDHQPHGSHPPGTARLHPRRRNKDPLTAVRHHESSPRRGSLCTRMASRTRGQRPSQGSTAGR